MMTTDYHHAALALLADPAAVEGVLRERDEAQRQKQMLSRALDEVIEERDAAFGARDGALATLDDRTLEAERMRARADAAAAERDAARREALEEAAREREAVVEEALRIAAAEVDDCSANAEDEQMSGTEAIALAHARVSRIHVATVLDALAAREPSEAQREERAIDVAPHAVGDRWESRGSIARPLPTATTAVVDGDRIGLRLDDGEHTTVQHAAYWSRFWRRVSCASPAPRLFDVWANGYVHYTRPEGDPLLDEARGRPGYEVRPHVPPSKRVDASPAPRPIEVGERVVVTRCCPKHNRCGRCDAYEGRVGTLEAILRGERPFIVALEGRVDELCFAAVEPAAVSRVEPEETR